MAQPFVEQPLIRPNIFQRLLGLKVRRNALIEINNLLARADRISAVQSSDIEAILGRYRCTIHRLKKADRIDLYRQYYQPAIQAGGLTSTQLSELAHLRNLLGIDDEQAHELHLKLAGPIFQTRVDAEIADRRLSEEGWHNLLQTAAQLGLTEEDAQQLYQQQAQAVLDNYLAQVIADERISPDEDRKLLRLASDLKIPLELKENDKHLIDRLRLLWQIEHGKLPEVPAPVILRPGERCHFAVDASWLEYRTVTSRISYGGPTLRFRIAKGVYWRMGDLGVSSFKTDTLTRIDQGELLLTSKRLIFLGSRRNTTINLSRVLNFEPYKNGVKIEKTTGRDTFFEFTGDTQLFVAILNRLLRGESA